METGFCPSSKNRRTPRRGSTWHLIRREVVLSASVILVARRWFPSSLLFFLPATCLFPSVPNGFRLSLPQDIIDHSQWVLLPSFPIADFFFFFVWLFWFCCLGEECTRTLDAEHVAEAAKEGDSKTKDSDRDGNAGVAGTLFGGSDFRADEVGDGVAAALGLNLLDHGGKYRGGVIGGGWRGMDDRDPISKQVPHSSFLHVT